jgi:cytochrome c553
MRNALALLLVLCIPSFSARAEVVGDADAGKTKNSMCIGCHGIPMYKTAFPAVYSVPMIAGQSSQYIVKALQEYREDARSHPTMRAIAKGLNDQDMADVAAYYSGGGKAAK